MSIAGDGDSAVAELALGSLVARCNAVVVSGAASVARCVGVMETGAASVARCFGVMASAAAAVARCVGVMARGAASVRWARCNTEDDVGSSASSVSPWSETSR